MGTQQKDLIREKLTRLIEYIDEVSPYLKQSYRKYVGRKGDQRIVERLAQIIVETASDTNDLLIAESHGSPAPHARASFEQVRDMGVLPAALAERFIDRYVRMRNLIVHEYDRLDVPTVFHTSRRLIKDAGAYVGAVTRYLASAANE
ncbi:MAG: DUF86 domain-containing protein [Chloroflexi bacterium]|nr:DUF86 domain-containing protein [Chloroflexota bacterium]MBI3764071.1 DUF86 domain-containing protein [Chloroflexota bacterium]